jgi:hypothetical protein
MKLSVRYLEIYATSDLQLIRLKSRFGEVNSQLLKKEARLLMPRNCLGSVSDLAAIITRECGCNK